MSFYGKTEPSDEIGSSREDRFVMMSRSVVAAALLLSACSKSEPDTSTTTPSAPPTTAAVAPGALAPAAVPAPDDEHERPMKHGMSADLPMPMPDGGMPMRMPGHP